MQDYFDQILHGRDMAQHFLEISEAIILSVDLDRRVRILNKTGQRILGYSEQEILGKNWFEIAVPPEYRAAVLRDFDLLVSSDTTTVMRFENEVLAKSGERIYVRWNDTLVRDDHGKVVGVLSSGIDLTAQKRAQEALLESASQLQDFNDASSDWLWEMAADLKISYLSPSLSRIIEAPTDNLLGKTRAELIQMNELPAEQREKWQ
ncbi:MAG TPA: PAS domain S-box protein, partial [Magnetovibrio sp.]